MRYLWETSGQYFQFGRGLWWKSAALQLVSPWLRRFDASSSRGVHFFLANSENVRGRIRRIYGTEARVIYPPIDTKFFAPEECAKRAPGPPGGDYYLVVSSLEPYKRIDLAVGAFSGGCRRLLVVGAGTLHNVLRARARPPVEFLGEVSDVRLRDLYRHCRALIFPGLEDFGIAPVEAQACGRPVVCYGAGGALETVSDGKTGVHFRPQTSEALLAAVRKLEKSTWDPQLIRRHSLQFSRERFRKELMSFLYDAGILGAA
jgi:glycosyltransferase involved in cell wall biosynthesis